MGNPFVEKHEGKNDKSRLIGGNVPIDVADYFRLVAVHQGKSIQSLLLEILLYWQIAEGENENLMTDTLADKAHIEWLKYDNVKGRGLMSVQRKYINEMNSALTNLKLSKKYINNILGALIIKMKLQVGRKSG